MIKLVRGKLPQSRRELEKKFVFGGPVDKKMFSAWHLEKLAAVETVWKKECAKYARLAAERLFGLKYLPANANVLGRKNRVIWDSGKGGKKPQFERGQILGIFLPESEYLKKGWKFTHSALLVMPQGDDWVIAHNKGGFLRIDLLNDFLRQENAKVMQVIAPKYPAGIDPEWAEKEEARIREAFRKLKMK